MPHSVPDMTDSEYAIYLTRLQEALNTALDVARHVHIEKSSLDDEDRGYIAAEYRRLVHVVGEVLDHQPSAGLDYRVDYPASGDDTPAGFALCVRIKLEIVPEPVTAEDLAQVPRPLEDLP
jgi:hypothetical protein